MLSKLTAAVALLLFSFAHARTSYAQTSNVSVGTRTLTADQPFAFMPDRQDVTLYQVNMRVFSRDGNFQGVIDRLDSIKAMGVNVIYLMPHYPVGRVKSVNSPYCISDYKAVNPEFGTLDDLRRLVSGAHDRKMAVILDWVANHTSYDNVWMKNKSWYQQDSAGNVISPPGTGWNDVAQLNFNNADMRIAMIDAMKYWIHAANVDGFRCDYSDGPPVDFWKQALDTLHGMPGRKLLMLSEGRRSEHFTIGFDYNFGFEFFSNLKRIFERGRTALSIDSMNVSDYKGAAADQRMVRYTSNHDVNGSDGTPLELFGAERGSMAAFVVASYMKSVPMVYGGQEVGTPQRLTFPFTSTKINWTINAPLKEEYKRLIAFRNDNAALRRGALVSYTTPDICAFTKELAGEKVFVVVNLRNESREFVVPANIVGTAWSNVMEGSALKLSNKITLQPYQYLILSKPQGASTSVGKVRLTFELDADGRPKYAVDLGGRSVITPSRLGFELEDGVRLDSNFQLTGVDSAEVDEKWTPVWGEVKEVRNKYRQLTFKLRERANPNRVMHIVFRVFEDGVGFRYEFPLQPHMKFFVVSKEVTAFNLSGDHKAFWIPGDYNSNEYTYTTSPLSAVDAWKAQMISNGKREHNIPNQYAVQTPLMMKTADGLYINIHEAAQVNYPSLQLTVDKIKTALSADLVPDAVGNAAYMRTPGTTPWRTIIVSDKATDILASRMIINLNEPSKIEDPSWIRPMKYMGVWWEMQTSKSSWNYTDDIDKRGSNGQLIAHGRHGANTANVKRYIDFASKNGIGGLLVEGWNTGWEEWTGMYKEENFDFTTPYPDFNIKEITDYAKSKGVQMIMHHETGGSAANYDRQMDTAFRMMNAFGYPAVKTGYVGKIIPAGEHHDGQWMANHYLRAAQKAARYKVMINMHEPMRPTGLHRTWPNFLASEAGRGNEWNAFSEGSPPEHETILPFTRLIGGPMDYTPGIFKMRNYAVGAPDRQMHSTLAKQLALYVTIYSPLQMAADLPENYEAHPDAFQFIKDVALDWDDTKIIEAEPGDYLTIARKEKGSDNWFIGAITDENARVASIPLSFLEDGRKYIATVYRDGDGADWKSNPESYKIERFVIDQRTTLKCRLANGGGAAVSIVPVADKDIKGIKKYK